MANKRRSSRLNAKANVVRKKGRYATSCGSSIHDKTSNSELCTQYIDLIKKENILASQYQELIQKGVVTEESLLTCKHCFNSVISSKTINPAHEIETNLSDENSDEGRAIEYIELVEELRDRVQMDITDIYYNEKIEKIDDLIRFNRLDWISKRPAELVNFLSGLCSIDLNAVNEKKLNLICKTIELIYYYRNSKLVLPKHFIENLVSYTCTSSKINCNFQGSLVALTRHSHYG